jgi:hypothetical protein
VPSQAQDRIVRGPFAALLILLSLLVGSGGAAAAGADIRNSARLSPSRQSASVALLPAGTRNGLEDEASAASGDKAVPVCEAGIVTERPWARPAADAPGGDQAPLPEPAGPSHRARAPPAD